MRDLLFLLLSPVRPLSRLLVRLYATVLVLDGSTVKPLSALCQVAAACCAATAGLTAWACVAAMCSEQASASQTLVLLGLTYWNVCSGLAHYSAALFFRRLHEG